MRELVRTGIFRFSKNSILAVFTVRNSFQILPICPFKPFAYSALMVLPAQRRTILGGLNSCDIDEFCKAVFLYVETFGLHVISLSIDPKMYVYKPLKSISINQFIAYTTPIR